MSISRLPSASRATDYYLQEENPNLIPDLSLIPSATGYYLKEQSQGATSFWHGTLAEPAGLLGQPVEANALESVLNGTLNGETIKGRREQHKSGFDLTFSAPKNASILALVGGDTRLLAAHDKAVKYALSELEKDVAQVKVTRQKGVQTFENTESMIFAVIRHKTSRNNDPQLHSHALAANMTRDQNGDLRALASCLKQKGGVIHGSGERIYHFQKYYTALYQSAFAHQMPELGYQSVGLGQGQSDILGMPEALHKAFSTRKQQIDQQVMSFGYDTPASRDTAALDTRPSKTYHSDATLTQRWQQTVKEHGFDPAQLVAQCQTVTAPDKQTTAEADDAFARAVTHLGQYSTSLTLEKIIALAASEFTKGSQAISAIELKHIADQWIKDGRLLPLSEQGQYTSNAMLQTERRLMAITQGRRHHMRTLVDTGTLNALNLSLPHQQKVADIYGSTKQFHVVNVYGASEQIAQSLFNAGQHTRKRVQWIAQTSQQHRINQQRIMSESTTLSAWVRRLFPDDRRHTLGRVLNGDYPLTNQDILLVDQANQMSAAALLALTEKANQAHCKVILLNRVSSRQGMSAHNALTLYSKGNVTVHRWVNDKRCDAQVRLHQHAPDRIARVYADLPDKTNTQVLATSGVEQRRLTEAIRTTLRNDGQLARSSITLFTQQPHFLSPAQQGLAKHYKVGMTLRQWRRKTPLDVVIARVDVASNTLETVRKTDGHTQTFDPSSSTFRLKKMQVFKPGSLEISRGERVIATQPHRLSGLNADTSYTVTKISQHQVTFTDPEGLSRTVPVRALKDAPLIYDYVHSTRHLVSKAHTLLSGKAYSLSKPLLNDLIESSRRVDIFTDHPNKALRALEKADVRPSATERVLPATGANDRYFSSATASTLQHDIEQALSLLAHQHQKPALDKAVHFALAHLSEKDAAFTQKALVIEAVRYAFEETTTPITKADIEAQLAKRKEALSVEYSDGTRWTTNAALATERRILDNIAQGKNQHSPFATPQQVQAYLETQPHLTEGQRDAIALITTTKDSFVAIQGLAGTGKSTLLSSCLALIEQHRQSGHTSPQHILGLAPTHSTVSELTRQGLKAQTLESLLTDLRLGVVSPKDHRHSVFFLDESSMVSNQQAKAFTDLVISSESKAVLLGDKEQLLSLNAGKPFELAMGQAALHPACAIDTVQMTDIVRQRQPATLSAVHNILDKQPDSALDKLNQQKPDPQGRTEHVISTLDESHPNRRQAQRLASDTLPYAVAKDYLSRPADTRERTLIIAYTNQERDAISEHIRSGLMQRQELDSQNIMAPRLRSVGASREELKTMMPYQTGLVLSKRPGHYATITDVHPEHGVVIIRSHRTGREQAFLPRQGDHKRTALFSVSHKPLSVGDEIVTRFTDKTRGIKANITHRVVQAAPDGIVAHDQDARPLLIDPNQLKDGHWDYAYTRTADMAQGSTYPHVITAIKGKGALTDFRRAYIDLTRASEHVRLYTDNPKQMIQSWLSKNVHKASAIETLSQAEPSSTVYFNDRPLPHEDVRYQNSKGEFSHQAMKTHLLAELPRYTESLATRLLGQPNLGKSNQDAMTFGTGNTSVTVTLTGQYRGYFKDYTTGEHGSLLNLIMTYQGLEYPAAMHQAHRLLEEPERYQLMANPRHDELIGATPKPRETYAQRAKAYWQDSQSVTDTLAQAYLNHAGVNAPDNEHVRFHPAVYSSEDRLTHPAMLTRLHDQQGHLQAVSVTYLDAFGSKNPALTLNPRVLGRQSKHLTWFHHGQDTVTTLISTSVEHAFLMVQDTQGQYDVLHVPHHQDIANIPADEVRQRVIIVLAQQDQALSPIHIDKIVEAFSTSKVQFVSEEDMLNQITRCIEQGGPPQSSDPAARDEPALSAYVDALDKPLTALNEKDSQEIDDYQKTAITRQGELALDPPHERDIETDLSKELER